MTFEMLQSELNRRAIVLSMDGQGKLQCQAPKGAITQDIAQAIKEHLPALIAALSALTEQVHDDEAAPYTEPLPDREYAYLTDSEYQSVLHMRAFFGKCKMKGLHILLGPALDPCNFKVVGAEPHRTQALRYIINEHNQEYALIVALEHLEEHLEEKETETTIAIEQEHKRRVTVYADVHQGQALADTGASLTFTPDCSLYELLTSVWAVTRCQRLFICGDLPQGYEQWLMDAGMWQEHTTGKRGHYFDREKAENHVARFQHRVTGDEIEIRTAYSWFGETAYTVEEAAQAMQLLNQYLKSTFVNESEAYATPALTFQSLWKLVNRLEGKKFQLLPDDIRSLIHSSSGQGRVELCTLDKLDKLKELHYYDGIFMYAALGWGLPTEVETHDHEDRYAGKVPARYRIHYTVPADWCHVGLFMTPKDKVTGDTRDNEAWCYPGEAYQGQTFETWADGSELDVLREYYLPQIDNTLSKESRDTQAMALGMLTWQVVILERIVFKSEKDSTVKKPLDGIVNKLVKLRAKVEQDAGQDSTRAPIYKLVRGMIRNILLHGIGSFHRNNRDVTYIARADEAPDGYTNIRPLSEDLFVYTVKQQTEAYTQQFEHPEWPQLIWARCRARMTKAALSLPREQIIAIRTDAIALSADQPQWNENTAVGALRKKWHIAKRIQAPHTFEALDALVHKHVKGEDR